MTCYQLQFHFLQMVLHSFPDPQNTAASVPAETVRSSSHPLLTKLRVSLFVRVCTLTNTTLGFIIVDVSNITQALVAALLIIALCCSTHTWILTLVHI